MKELKVFFGIALLIAALAIFVPKRESAQIDNIHVTSASSSYSYITSAATTSVKGTSGTLRKVIPGTGVALATVKVYDTDSGGCTGTPASGLMATLTFPATLTNPEPLEFNATLGNGICVVTSGSTLLTVIYD